MSNEINTFEQSEPQPSPPPPKRKSLDRRFWIDFGCGVVVGICLIVGAAIVFSIYMVNRRDRAVQSEGKTSVALRLPSLPNIEQADYGLNLEDLEGKAFDTQSLRGKVVFLNFWATWCAPCRAEMPAIQRLYEKTKGDGVIFLVVSSEKREKIADYVKKNGYSFQVFRETSSQPKVYKARAIPATFIVSPGGRIALKHIGSAQWDHESVVTYLKNLKSGERDR